MANPTIPVESNTNSIGENMKKAMNRERYAETPNADQREVQDR